MASHLPVLIVGAGPSGLIMACELARREIPFRIIDKKAEPTHSSNATWIQTRTLEVFEQLGLIDRFLKAGHICHAINLYEKGELLVKIPFSCLDSTYPFVLMLPQAETERLLREKLASFNHPIERSLELIELKQENNRVTSTLKQADGKIEIVESDWLIACDGANSTVRQKAGIRFEGKDFPEQFMVADAKMSSFLDSHEIHVFLDKGSIFPEKGTLFAAFPFGSNRYRVTANLYLSHPRQSFTEIEVKEVVTERASGNYTIEKVSWIAPFWIHDKIADHMRLESIFLVGDAAHIHSPVGGQGMNTGIQDAYNLAWKLALVIEGKAKRTLLDSYQAERYPIMKAITKLSSELTEMALFDPSFYEQLRHFSQKIAKHPTELVKEIGMGLTQLNLQYQGSPIIAYGKKSAAIVKPGERIPNALIKPGQSLFNYLDKAKHNILLFTGLTFEEKNLAKLHELQNCLKNAYPDLIKVILISTEENPTSSNDLINDSNGTLHKAYQVKEPIVSLIRPDNILAYYSTQLKYEPLEKLLSLYLNKA